MVKHTQTSRLQSTDELFECVWPFLRLVDGFGSGDAADDDRIRIKSNLLLRKFLFSTSSK